MRRQLAQLDDRLLRDIGVDPEMRDGIGKVRGFAEALQTMRDHR